MPTSSLLLQVPVAVAAWRELLQGRFRLLDRWCSFMTSSYKQLVVTEDTWTQVCCTEGGGSCCKLQWLGSACHLWALHALVLVASMRVLSFRNSLHAALTAP